MNETSLSTPVKSQTVALNDSKASLDNSHDESLSKLDLSGYMTR